MNVTHITAENAPIGVQLWPTTTTDDAPNFTLQAVETITRVLRDASGVYEYRIVVWTYENGTTRNFDLGEEVAVNLGSGGPRSEGATP